MKHVWFAGLTALMAVTGLISMLAQDGGVIWSARIDSGDALTNPLREPRFANRTALRASIRRRSRTRLRRNVYRHDNVFCSARLRSVRRRTNAPYLDRVHMLHVTSTPARCFNRPPRCSTRFLKDALNHLRRGRLRVRSGAESLKRFDRGDGDGHVRHLLRL